MTTLADLTADISDDLDDTAGEYGAAILKAVQGAQRDCERFTFYFNETRDVTFSTVISQQWYGAAANANIPTLVHIQEAYYTDTGGNILILVWSPPEELEILSDSTSATGQPSNYTYFNKQIRLYPIPNAVYTVRLQLGPYRLGALANPSDNNAWLDDAYDLLKARAKYRLWKNTLFEPGHAAEAMNDYNEQFAMLKAETSKRNGSGYIRSTEF